MAADQNTRPSHDHAATPDTQHTTMINLRYVALGLDHHRAKAAPLSGELPNLPEVDLGLVKCQAKTIARIVAAISGGGNDFMTALGNFPAMTAKHQPITTRLRTRRWPWQRRTTSWPVAYNLACVYAALAACPDAKTKPDSLVEKVICSLEFALCNPECEMEHPSEWIGHDPDFSLLCDEKTSASQSFSMNSGNGITRIRWLGSVLSIIGAS
jgi:hypothetical protein